MGAGGSIKKAPEDGKAEEAAADSEATKAMEWLTKNLGPASDVEIAEALKALPEDAKAKLLRATAPNGDQKDYVEATPEEMAAAATKVQSLQRGKQARVEVEKKKTEKALGEGGEAPKADDKKKEDEKKDGEKKEFVEATPEEMNDAATKVQALQRGKQARAEVEKKKTAKLDGEKKEEEAE